MMTASSDLVRWSRRDWVGVVVLVFIAQFALVLTLSDRGALRSKSRLHQTDFTLSGDRPAADPLLDFELQSELFFTGPTAVGFSGYAWLHKKEQSYMVTTNRTAPQMLRFAEAQQLLPNNLTATLQSAPPSRREIRIPPYTAPPSLSQPLAAASRLALEGFDGRQLRKPPVLNPQYHSDVLNSTVIQAAVDADGFTRFARVLQGSGSRAADNEALAVTRASRFTPHGGRDGDRENLDWGKLIFHWHTLELTNKTAAPR